MTPSEKTQHYKSPFAATTSMIISNSVIDKKPGYWTH